MKLVMIDRCPRPGIVILSVPPPHSHILNSPEGAFHLGSFATAPHLYEGGVEFMRLCPGERIVKWLLGTSYSPRPHEMVPL